MNVSDMSMLAFLTLRLFQAVSTLYIFNIYFFFALCELKVDVVVVVENA